MYTCRQTPHICRFHYYTCDCLQKFLSYISCSTSSVYTPHIYSCAMSFKNKSLWYAGPAAAVCGITLAAPAVSCLELADLSAGSRDPVRRHPTAWGYSNIVPPPQATCMPFAPTGIQRAVAPPKLRSRFPTVYASFSSAPSAYPLLFDELAMLSARTRGVYKYTTFPQPTTTNTVCRNVGLWNIVPILRTYLSFRQRLCFCLCIYVGTVCTTSCRPVSEPVTILSSLLGLRCLRKKQASSMYYVQYCIKLRIGEAIVRPWYTHHVCTPLCDFLWSTSLASLLSTEVTVECSLSASEATANNRSWRVQVIKSYRFLLRV